MSDNQKLADEAAYNIAVLMDLTWTKEDEVEAACIIKAALEEVSTTDAQAERLDVLEGAKAMHLTDDSLLDAIEHFMRCASAIVGADSSDAESQQAFDMFWEAKGDLSDALVKHRALSAEAVVGEAK